MTAEARRALFLAHEEAAHSGESYIGTEHLLLGMTQESETAARLLDRVGVPVAGIRSEIQGHVTRGRDPQGQDLQLTPLAKQVLHLAYEEARHLGIDYVGTEHLLLGLSGVNDGLAARVLKQLGADVERLRQGIQAT